MHRAALTFALFLTLGGSLVMQASTASAQVYDGSQPGTHFMVEGTVGTSVPLDADGDGAGISTGALLGFGGKFKGSVLRAYAVAGFTWADYHVTRGPYSLQRTVNELSFGGRLMVPVFIPNIRIFADAMLGVTWLRHEERAKSGTEITVLDDEPRTAALLGVGVQFRPLLWLSLGVQSDFALLLDRAELVEAEGIGRVDLLGSATFHF